MSKDQIKYEINKVLDLLPDKALEDLLSFLKNVEGKSNDSFLDDSRLKRILNEPLASLEIKEWLQLLRPGFNKIEIEHDLSSKAVIQFYENGYDKPFGENLISDGTRNILCILTAIYNITICAILNEITRIC